MCSKPHVLEDGVISMRYSIRNMSRITVHEAISCRHIEALNRSASLTAAKSNLTKLKVPTFSFKDHLSIGPLNVPNEARGGAIASVIVQRRQRTIGERTTHGNLIWTGRKKLVM